MDLLQSDQRFNDKQTVTLLKKIGRQAKCRTCRTDILPQSTCFSVEGASTVLFESDKTIVQIFYFCAGPCIISTSPPWTNIRLPTHFSASQDISEEECRQIEGICKVTFEA